MDVWKANRSQYNVCIEWAKCGKMWQNVTVWHRYKLLSFMSAHFNDLIHITHIKNVILQLKPDIDSMLWKIWNELTRKNTFKQKRENYWDNFYTFNRLHCVRALFDVCVQCTLSFFLSLASFTLIWFSPDKVKQDPNESTNNQLFSFLFIEK